MKAILLSAATGLLLFILCTACLRYSRPHNRVRMLGGLFLALLPLLALAHIATPPDLGFLSQGFFGVDSWFGSRIRDGLICYRFFWRDIATLQLS